MLEGLNGTSNFNHELKDICCWRANCVFLFTLADSDRVVILYEAFK
uniref:Uncharacterized protein n=1 Tax=Parascaris equorum TaxID=6256 RepID=A0A914RBD3_PAREQ